MVGGKKIVLSAKSGVRECHLDGRCGEQKIRPDRTKVLLGHNVRRNRRRAEGKYVEFMQGNKWPRYLFKKAREKKWK